MKAEPLRPEVVIKARARIGEGPVIDARSGRLCWVDIPRGVLHQSSLDTGAQESWTVATSLGAVAPRSGGPGFAVASGEGFGFLVDGVLEVVDRVLPEPFRRMNDAKCDPWGRMWAGSLDADFRENQGALHCWEPGSPSRVVLDGLTLPNGLGWSPDNQVMYLVDSSHRVLYSSRCSSDGEPTGFSPLVEIDRGLPDGLAVDVDGGIWLALWGGSQVRRYDPRGRLIGLIDFPVAKPSSCAFGSNGTLYVTSATDGLTSSELAEQPAAGSVFGVVTPTRGVPVPPFAG